MTSDGAWSEPLQVPDYSHVDLTKPRGDPPHPPELWDRSSLPAGACVFRVHGVNAGCLGESPYISYGACRDSKLVVPISYYESNKCEEGIAPGCPSEDVLSSQGWWYAVTDPHEPDVLTVVICAPVCWSAGAGASMCLYRR